MFLNTVVGVSSMSGSHQVKAPGTALDDYLLVDKKVPATAHRGLVYSGDTSQHQD